MGAFVATAKGSVDAKNPKVKNAPVTPATPERVGAATPGCPHVDPKGRREDRSHAHTPNMTIRTRTVADVLPPAAGPGPVTG